MTYLILSILCSVLLLVNFRFFPKFNINTHQAVSFNYITCFIVGFLISNVPFELDMGKDHTWPFLVLGVGFIVTFVFSGIATQRVGMSLTSIANNISLIIPVLFSLFVFKVGNQDFSLYNYLGIVLGFVSILLVSIDKKEALLPSSFKNSMMIIALFLLYGFTNTCINYFNIKYIKNPSMTIPMTLIMVLGAAAMGVAWVAYRYVKFGEKIESKNLIASVLLGIPNFLSFYFLIQALHSFENSGAYIYPIYNIGVMLLSVLTAFLVFKENLTKMKWLGLVVAVLSIILLSI